ncbi:MAG TPA: carboxymuconolactone decarboxylase family protein [Ramlibacter sp.]|nr:carboxymuconolactone decarboxylase family protein [Ramlibacter sp.]
MKSRLHLPEPEEMTAEQRAVYESVLHTRKNAQGPFLAWLLSPGLADPAQQLGSFCRYRSTLSVQESELLILHVAAHYGCVGERQIHEPIALRAGLSQDVVFAIRSGEEAPVPTSRLRLLAQCARELLVSKRLNDRLYGEAVAALGEKTLVEVVGIVGYYALVAYTLNAFEMRVE